MTVIIGSNYNLIADLLSIVVIACLFALACRGWYKEGYRDGKEEGE